MLLATVSLLSAHRRILIRAYFPIFALFLFTVFAPILYDSCRVGGCTLPTFGAAVLLWPSPCLCFWR